MSSGLFSDGDGSLCFHEVAHNIQLVDRISSSRVKVRDPKTQKLHICYDISTDLYKVYFSLKTQGLCYQAAKEHDFIYVSGARKSSIDNREKEFRFVNTFILENGGLIIDKFGRVDRNWSYKLEPEKKYLTEVKKQLTAQGWNLDVKGRRATIRVRRKDNPSRSDAEYQEFCDTIELPDELQKTKNLNNLDIILRSAGKDRAVKYLIEKMGYEATVGIGDDINDISFLNLMDQAYFVNGVLGTSAIAHAYGFHLSKGLHFDGINEILEMIIAQGITKRETQPIRTKTS